MSELDPTQALPAEQEPPATPPVQKPTLASLIVSEMQDIRKHEEIANANTVVYWGGLSADVARLQSRVIVLSAIVAFLSVAVVACLVFEAILVGHVR